ncbi:unnamed protein product [Urochloa decumbens]|uniref:BHLH domain-containing protein n=1 Tax=Urochloa decumbens TaxID=240449 RepID=A0ABC9GG21_9POAL
MAMALPASPVQAEPQPGNKQFRNHLAAAVRSINWSYATFWSVSSTGPAGVLTWKEGFYNGEVKTRKVTNSTSQLTADQLALQRSEQLRELYESLQLPGGDSHHHRGKPPRPTVALSPEDLGDTEWFYVICMTYAFRPGQGLPGKSLATNEQVWLRNAHLADSKTFPRALLAKISDNSMCALDSSSLQTIVCIPLMDGVLELGTTDLVLEDPDLVNRATAPFRELQFPARTVEPSSSPSADNDIEEDAAAETIVFDEIDHTDTAMEPATVSDGQELSKFFTECLPGANLEEVTMEIDELYGFCEGLDVQPLEEDWIAMDGLLELPPSSDQPDHTLSTTVVDGSRFTSFKAWTRPESDGAAAAAAIKVGEAQKMLKKVVSGGGAWAANNNNGDGDGSTTTRTMMTQESGVVRNHVISERRRREKLNEMFVILKSLVPSTRKVDKASILAETIAYLKELEQKVQDLESCKDNQTATRPAARRHVDEVVGTKKVAVSVGDAKRKKGSELHAGDDRRTKEQRHSSKDCPSNISITVTGKEVLLDVQCRWKERLVARVFDAVKGLRLNVLSVQSSTLNGLLGLKFASSSAAVAPGMITEALQKAISGKP